MTKLSVDDFDKFFSELWSTPGKSRPPFQWQRDLAHRIFNRDDTPWPEAIALPTAAGKTACIDIALFALAAQADRLGTDMAITAPRRIFFVVDRRVIVDEAFDRARTLASKLRMARGGVIKTVADNLRRIARGDDNGFEHVNPLAVHALRGGMYRSEAWAHDPLQPTIIASTVDQFGSRILFRAYGRGPRMWPVYAGLAANDSLILLDEAHCARPFMQTLQCVNRFRIWAKDPLKRSFFPVVMSATPPEGLEKFEDASSERMDPDHPLGKRQLAHKPAVLEKVRKAKGAKAIPKLAVALVKAAESLVNDERQAVVIFVNRVATARAVYELLNKKHCDRTVLLTGRMRPIDKDDIVSDCLKPLSSAESETRKLEAPYFVVATQTLEVGADLDFDALVTECASLDALRQRFGRLNRMGRPITARAAILFQVDQSDDDPIYGAALANTWAWLCELQDDAGEVDFGIACLESRLPDGETLIALNAPSVDAPVMLPAHIDCWVQTAPVPVPSPDIALFLHGPRKSMADVQVCWRADLYLNSEEGKAQALESLSLCPPSSIESLSVPIGVVKSWLMGREVVDESPDVEGIEAEIESEQKNDIEEHRRRVIRWLGRETCQRDVIDGPGKIRPGDIIVIPTATGNWQSLGDALPMVTDEPASLDLGDRAFLVTRAKPLLRLHPDLIKAWPEGQARTLALALLERFTDFSNEDLDEIAAFVREILAALAHPEDPFSARWSWLSQSAEALLKESGRISFRRAIRPVGAKTLFVIGQALLLEKAHEADVFSDEDDASASGISRPNGEPVKLFEHLPGVAAFARRFAKGCGLPNSLVDALEKAGLFHDMGKADPRFQALLRGGNRWMVRELLAKSGDMRMSPQAAMVARKASGYPENGRHELLSVRLAENAPEMLPEDPTLRDLILHLVASHHGYCRPFAPVIFDEEPPEIVFEFSGYRFHWQGPTGLERLDSDVADRFWRLVRCYGWWGLAWLESLLRLADHRRSEWEETHCEFE